MIGLGDDVIQKTLRNYFAFKRIKNFTCVEIKSQINGSRTGMITARQFQHPAYIYCSPKFTL